MWQAKTCILEMFLDFYGAYSGNKSNYRDFLKDILIFYEQNAVKRLDSFAPTRDGSLYSSNKSSMFPRYSSTTEPSRASTDTFTQQTIQPIRLHRIHNNIFDIASRQSLTFDVDNYTGASAPLPRISGLCTTRAGPDVDIDFSRADEMENTAIVEEVDELPDRSESVVEVAPPFRHVKAEPDIWEPQVTVSEALPPVIAKVQQRPRPVSPVANAFRPPVAPARSSSSGRHPSGDSSRFTPSKGSRMKTGGGTPAPPKPASVVCNICHRQMTSYRALVRHRSAVHSHRPISCPRCKKSFVSRVTFGRHQRKSSCFAMPNDNHETNSTWHYDTPPTPPLPSHTAGAAAFVPPLDGPPRKTKGKGKGRGKVKKAKMKTKVRRAKKKEAKPKSPDRGGLRCSVSNCRNNFRGRAEYLEHLQEKHSDRKALLCDSCDKVFLSMRHLQAHRAKHSDHQLYGDQQDEPPELEPELNFDAMASFGEDGGI